MQDNEHMNYGGPEVPYVHEFRLGLISSGRSSLKFKQSSIGQVFSVSIYILIGTATSILYEDLFNNSNFSSR